MAELHRKAEPWPLSKTMISCNLLHHHDVHSSSGQIVWMAYSDYSGMFILQCKVSPKRVVSIRFLPCVALCGSVTCSIHLGNPCLQSFWWRCWIPRSISSYRPYRSIQYPHVISIIQYTIYINRSSPKCNQVSSEPCADSMARASCYTWAPWSGRWLWDGLIMPNQLMQGCSAGCQLAMKVAWASALRKSQPMACPGWGICRNQASTRPFQSFLFHMTAWLTPTESGFKSATWLGEASWVICKFVRGCEWCEDDFPIFSHIFTYHHLRPTRHLHWSYTVQKITALGSRWAPHHKRLSLMAFPVVLTSQFPRCCPNFTTFYKRKPTVCYLVIHAVCQMWTSYKISTWSNLNRIGQINWHMFFPLTSQGRALRRKGCLEPGSQCSWWNAIAARWTLCVNSFLRTQWMNSTTSESGKESLKVRPHAESIQNSKCLLFYILGESSAPTLPRLLHLNAAPWSMRTGPSQLA